MHKIFLDPIYLELKSLAPSGLEDVKIGVWYSKKPNLIISDLMNEIMFDLKIIFYAFHLFLNLKIYILILYLQDNLAPQIQALVIL